MNVSTKDLKNELRWIARFVEKRTTIPMLAHVAMESGNGRLSLIGTDLELSGLTSVPYQGDGGIKLTAPIRQLVRFLDGCKDGFVELTQESTEKDEAPVSDEPEAEEAHKSKRVVKEGPPTIIRLHVKTTTGNATFECMSMRAFPQLPPPPMPTIELNGLNQSIPKVLLAVSREESRFTLNGALMICDGETGKIVSTDGHRMSIVPITCKASAPCKTLIHRSALLEASKINGGHVLFGENDMFQLFLTGRRSVITRKLTGNFPDYERAIPKNHPHTATIDPVEAKQVIGQVAKFADSRSQALYFNFKSGFQISARAHTVEGGAAAGEFTAHWESGEGLDMDYGLNATYLLGFLALADGPVTASLSKAADAALFTNNGWQMVVMPMRI